LTINGRLYSFNTRGGSLKVNGAELEKITTNIGRFFNGPQLITNATPTQSASMDLERFRVILNDGNTTCTTSINYDPLSSLPSILQKPTGYSGGSCSF
jgi:hypothetical protein